ncbi:hypothetical protein [Mycobacterium marinum]|uniref:hypothetical protein n=1 Tax=Mycobacterium marinum TaxID=1781 RepID=UPI00115F2224|nr:hypothetical protein [Mycobacterium marinum]
MHAAEWISLLGAVASAISARWAVVSARRARNSQDAANRYQATAEQQARRATQAAEESVTAQRRSADAATTSATIAAAKEERAKYGWAVALHPNGDHYVLRNVGTRAAHDVKLENPDTQGLRARFLMHDDEGGPVIQPGEAKAFYATSTYSHPSVELVIDWLPEGESQRRAFN